MGAGKTTLAKVMEKEGKGIRLSPDEWLLAAGYDLNNGDARESIEARQREVARGLLKAGYCVILENGFWTAADRARYLGLARQVPARCDLHYLPADLCELEDRVRKRNEAAPPNQRIDIEVISVWFERFEPPNDSEASGFDAFFRH